VLANCTDLTNCKLVLLAQQKSSGLKRYSVQTVLYLRAILV